MILFSRGTVFACNVVQTHVVLVFFEGSAPCTRRDFTIGRIDNLFFLFSEILFCSFFISKKLSIQPFSLAFLRCVVISGTRTIGRPHNSSKQALRDYPKYFRNITYGRLSCLPATHAIRLTMDVLFCSATCAAFFILFHPTLLDSVPVRAVAFLC